MSTDLYKVRVCSVADAEVVFEVQSTYPDAPEVPRSKTYALQVIHDPVVLDPKPRKPSAGCPLGHEIAGDESPAQLQALAGEFIKSVKQRKLKEATRRAHPVWELSVKVTDPAWIQHLRKGMAWASAACDFGNGKAAKPRRYTPDADTGRSSDPMAGMKKVRVTQELRKDLSRDGTKRTCQLKEYIAPTLGVRSYVADPVLEGRQIGPGSLEKLLGQPVIAKYETCEPSVETIVWLSAGAKSIAWGGTLGLTGIGSRSGLEWIGRAWLKDSGSGARSASKRPTRPASHKTSNKPKPTKARKTPAKSSRARGASKPLAGKVVVVTGTFAGFSRKELTARLVEAGARITGSVSGKTDLLLCGSDPGSKLDDAKQRKIKVVKERALANLLR